MHGARHKTDEASGEHGEEVSGPPFVVGHRGTPREAPENTLAGLQLALDQGLDGVEFDVRGCATGEPVLIHDERLDRTTDATGRVAERTLPELAGVDAGGWFHKRFLGEPLPLLEEALGLDDPLREETVAPLRVLGVEDPRLIREIATQLLRLPRPLSIRIASIQRSVCLEARDQGLAAMLVAHEATQDELRFVRDERLAAFAAPPAGWRTPVGQGEWPGETWAWPADDPDELYALCRRPIFGIVTNVPRRALATRALASLAPRDAGPFPVRAPTLEVPVLDGAATARGEWAGRWQVSVDVRNPFPFPAELALALEVRGGAFEVEGLPVSTRLAEGEARAFPLALAGGSFSPGGDPLLHARYVWRPGPGHAREELVLSVPLRRLRTLRLAEGAVRLPMLRERPGQAPASMSVRRRGNEILAWVENAGGLQQVRARVRLGERLRYGGQGVRIRLTELELAGGRALPFSVGFEGEDEGAPAASGRPLRRLRRWAGGLPPDLRGGTPGRLILERTA